MQICLQILIILHVHNLYIHITIINYTYADLLILDTYINKAVCVSYTKTTENTGTWHIGKERLLSPNHEFSSLL